MALIYMDGFEHQDSRRYAVAAHVYAGASGRTGGTAAQTDFAGTSQVNFNPAPTSSTYYIGFGELNPGGSGNVFFNLRNSAKDATCLQVSCTGGSPPVVNKGSGAVIATSSITTLAGVWYHIGIEVTIGASTSGKLYVNQVLAASWSGVDTRNGGDLLTSGGIQFGRTLGGSTADTYLDDLYVMDGSGTRNNSWSGDLVVRTLFPNAAGSSTQWTVSPSGANYAAVDEAGSAGVDYVYSNVVGNSDLYGLQDLPATGVYEVKGVQVTGTLIASDGGAVSAAVLAKANGVTTEGPTTLLAPTAVGASMMLNEASPGVPWTKALADGMEAGVIVK